MIAALVLGLLNTLLRPILVLLTLPVTLITLVAVSLSQTMPLQKVHQRLM
jgi:uncharacterized membrane protein YvlD (DUF360 family)